MFVVLGCLSQFHPRKDLPPQLQSMTVDQVPAWHVLMPYIKTIFFMVIWAAAVCRGQPQHQPHRSRCSQQGQESQHSRTRDWRVSSNIFSHTPSATGTRSWTCWRCWRCWRWGVEASLRGHFLIIDDGTVFFTVAGAGNKEKTQKRSKGLAPSVAAACEASPSRCRSPKSPRRGEEEEKNEVKQCHFLLIEYNFGGCFPR